MMQTDPDQSVRDAYARAGSGDLAGAERLCREVLSAHPSHARALGLAGMLRLSMGDAGGAMRYLQDAVTALPDDPGLLEQLALAHLASRQHEEAETLFRRVMAFGNDHGILYMRLGLSLAGQSRHDEAVGFLRVAAAKNPEDPDIQLNLGNVLAEAGRPEEALAEYQQLLARYPGHALTLFNVGTLCRILGRLDEALATLQRARAVAPRDADVLVNLAATQEDLGALEDAQATLQAAVAIAPRHPGVLNGLGSVALRQRRTEEGIAYLERALAAQPGYADALINLGLGRMEQGRHGEARDVLEQARKASPRSADPLFYLGRLARREGRTADAIAVLREALDRRGSRAAVLNELAGAHRDAGDTASAVEAYRAAIAADPVDAAACYNLAELQTQHGALPDAVPLYREALARRPGHLRALAGLIHAQQHLCDWNGIEMLWEQLRAGLKADPSVAVPPFGLLSMPTTAAEQLAAARAWARQEMASGATPARGAPDAAGRIRIGYLSSGFRRHALAHLTAELFELHDRTRFDVTAYAANPDDGSAVRKRICDAVEHSVEVAGVSNSMLARRIAADGIDVLVDLDGYTQGSRNAVMGLRPAPVQVSWLGYPGTLGADCVDVILADRYVIPEGAEAGYSERVVRLPGCYQISDRHRAASPATTREQAGLPAGAVVLCCFNQAYKILPAVFGSWMRVLAAVPGSVLWLAEANPWSTANLCKAAASHGVAADRIVFAPRRPLDEHLGRYRIADLAIDTFPYGSHTTAGDALWMGCPLATHAGDTFASRVAGSILTHAGFPELVAQTADEYERLVIALASAPDRLRELRGRIEAGRAANPLFDTPRFVRDLEAAYEAMTGNRVAGA